MPYITEEQRKKLDPIVEDLRDILNDHTSGPEVKGEYNYVITKLIHNYIEKNGLRYHHLNDAVGILECVKQEFYHKVVIPYENSKSLLNGSISELDAANTDEMPD